MAHARRSRLHRGLLAVAVGCLVLGVPAPPTSALAPLNNPARVLLMVVDGNPPIPRSLHHYENGQVTNVTWSNVSTLHHFAFDRSTSFASLFQEMSYGQTTITGDSLLMSFPHAASDYTWYEWADLADAEAASRGYDLSSYDRFLYVLPHLPKDAPAVGSASGARGWCAALTVLDLGCVFHEFGHTIGMTHAADLLPDGSTNGYGDDSDGLMGLGFNAHVNVVNKVLAGWMTGPRLETFDATGSTTRTLAAQSVGTATLQALKIVNNGARPLTGVVDTFVSFRDTQGFDAQLDMSLPDINGDDVADSVLVHLWYRFRGGDVLYRRALREGDSYSEHGVTVTVDDITGSQATVTASRAPYHPSAPQVSVSPGNFDSQPWEYVYYTVFVTNTNDPAQVSFDSHYDVSVTLPQPGWSTGWTSSLAKTVAPGATEGFQFWVKPPGSTGLGAYAFSVTATDLDGDAGPVSHQDTAYYTVTGPLDTTPPSTPTGLQGSMSGEYMTLTWNPSSDDLSGLSAYEVLRYGPDGFQFVDNSLWGLPIYIGLAAPFERYAVRSVDRAGNVSGLSNVYTVPGFTFHGPACGLGFEVTLVLLPLGWLRTRRRARRSR